MTKKYRVNEIFYSIQGEGRFVGSPMVFVRFAGCNLSCAFCDTDHKKFEEMTAEEIHGGICRALVSGGLPVDPGLWANIPICFTGGEPMLQLDEELVWMLHEYEGGFPRLHVETNGTLSLAGVEKLLEQITISPKSPNIRPGVEEWLQNRHNGENILELPKIDLKLLLDLEADPGILSWMMQNWCRGYDFDQVFLQPVTDANGSIDAQEAVKRIMEFPGFRLSVQLHRLLNFC